jgi:hypothetical protein
MMRWILVLLCALWVPTAAFAQQRPLVTEDPETVGAGRLLLEYGFDYGRGVEYPTSGLQGNLLRLHLIGISVGVSSIAEIQIDGGFYNRLSITDRDPTAPLADVVTATDDSTTSVQDFTIGTKIKIIPEGMTAPGFGIRFATKLPNASNESGIGLDTTDFFISAVGAKTIQSVRVVGNLGLAILADPTRGDRQNDVLTYGASFARAITMSTEIVGEVNGHVDTRKGAPLPGTESRSIVRIGGRYTRGSWRGDAALLFGLASVDPGFGVVGGFTYVFDAFMVP